MVKIIKILQVFSVLLFLTATVRADNDIPPNPDLYSGKLSNYEGTWIINGKTEEDTNWTLEITSDGKYHLHNEYQDYEGDVIFTPGNKDYDKPDTLWLDFDPSLGIEIVLENYNGGLIDISGQGLIFVRPKNNIKIDEAEILENYSPEDMVGDWLLDRIVVMVGPFSFEFYNEDIMMDSYTGDTRLIIGFENGIVYQISEKLQARIPLIRYRNIADFIYFENPEPLACCYMFTAKIVNDIPGDSKGSGGLLINVNPMPEDAQYEMAMIMFFERITDVSYLE